jgi:hypothetical protein
MLFPLFNGSVRKGGGGDLYSISYAVAVQLLTSLIMYELDIPVREATLIMLAISI